MAPSSPNPLGSPFPSIDDFPCLTRHLLQTLLEELSDAGGVNDTVAGGGNSRVKEEEAVRAMVMGSRAVGSMTMMMGSRAVW